MKSRLEKIGVVFGGCSTEYSISLESAYAVIRHLNPEKYLPVPIGISRTGDWFWYSGEPERIRKDEWQTADCVPAVLSVSRSAKGLLLLKPGGTELIPLDVLFPVLHGKNGEDGSVQGQAALAGIRLAGCGILASALCMDKLRAHRMAELCGVSVPRGAVLEGDGWGRELTERAEDIGYPLFVKPVRSGSSFGISRVCGPLELPAAVELAFRYDDRVLLEEAIAGFEVGCAVLGTRELITGEPDEVELSGGFFDFAEKYAPKTSSVHVPARVGRETSEQIRETAKRLYHAMGCTGFARVDLFLTPAGELVFNEINTIPGFTEHSRYPAMMRAAGYSFGEVIDRILREAAVQ